MKNLFLLTSILSPNSNTISQIRIAKNNTHVKLTSLVMTCFLAIGAILISIQPVSAEASDINYTESLLLIYNSNLENWEKQNKEIISSEDLENDKLAFGAQNISWCPGDDLDIPIRGVSDDYQNIEISIVLGQNGVLLSSTEIINKADGVKTFRFKNVDRHLKIGDNVRLEISKYVPEGNTQPTLLNVDFSNISILANSKCK